VRVLQETDVKSVDRLLAKAEYAGLKPLEQRAYGLLEKLSAMAKPQTVLWGPSDGRPPGIVTSASGFVPWEQLSKDLNERLLTQLSRHIPSKCRVRLADFHDRTNWLIQIVDESGRARGFVWLGTNPDNSWAWDGLVRVGTAETDYSHEVWQVFQRYSDGSYRRVEARGNVKQ
jgi:hypothetical protein